MTKYSVMAVAEELMLDAADLQEIYEIFFSDAKDLLAVCNKCVHEQNNTGLAKALHNLKGAANNLRMQEIAATAAQSERLAAAGKEGQAAPYLLELRNKVEAMKEHINSFYSKRLIK